MRLKDCRTCSTADGSAPATSFTKPHPYCRSCGAFDVMRVKPGPISSVDCPCTILGSAHQQCILSACSAAACSERAIRPRLIAQDIQALICNPCLLANAWKLVPEQKCHRDGTPAQYLHAVRNLYVALQSFTCKFACDGSALECDKPHKPCCCARGITVRASDSALVGFQPLQCVCCRYAEKDTNMTFSATPLGEALVSGYRAMGLANLWTPDLRGKIEAGISAVAAGQRTKVGE